ncbi:MAG TPA: FadR/GntR family transcriptional regulator [Steroidobacteraceae bacterium]
MPKKGAADARPAEAGSRSLRLHGTIARDIGVRIVSGRIQPGAILNGEIEASERLHVSRTAYREAVRILAAKGMVESRPKFGTRISEPRRWHLLDPDVISWIFSADQPDERLLEALFEMRTIIEPAATALAAERRTEAHLQALRNALDLMAEKSLAGVTGQAADREFHSVLLEASGNAFLASFTSGVAAGVAWTTIYKQRKSPLARDPIPDHERVYEAVAKGDPAAAREAMTTLIRLALLDTTRGGGKKGARGNGKKPKG